MKNRKGFTLVETLLALAVMGICFALALPFVGSQRELWNSQTEIREEFETITAALQWIARDLQGAGCGTGENPVKETAPDAVSYVVPGDDPGPAAWKRENLRLVRLYTAGNNLMYRIRTWDVSAGGWSSGSSHKLASNLTALSFAFFGRAGAPAASPEEVRAVEITIAGLNAGSMKSFVSLRNGPPGR